MKNLILLSFFFLSTCAFSQISLVPDFSNRAYYIKDSSLKDFERAEATLNANAATGLLSWSVFNNTSTLVIKQNEIPSIIIKVEGGANPAEIISLNKVDIKKDRRIINTGKKLGGKSKNVSQSEVKLSFKKLSNGVFQIISESPLTSGEYIFLPIQEANAVNILSPSKIKVSCFRIE